MKKSSHKIQREMLALERFFPHHYRERAEETLFALSLLFLTFSVFFNLVDGSRFDALWPISEGLFLVSFALLLKTILIEIYFHSLRVRLEKDHGMSFATFLILSLHHPKRKDLAKAFFHSRLGKEVALRLGIAHETLHHFTHTKEPIDLALPSSGSLPEMAGYLHDEDPYFRDFLERVHVSKELLMRSSEEAEKKHHSHLSTRPLLAMVFKKEEPPTFSLEHAARTEVHEMERFYRIIITEQATQSIVIHFKEDMLRYVSEAARTAFMAELIEFSLSAHRERFHGASIILPADVRHFLISKKALE